MKLAIKYFNNLLIENLNPNLYNPKSKYNFDLYNYFDIINII